MHFKAFNLSHQTCEETIMALPSTEVPFWGIDSAFKPLRELQMIHWWSALEEECTPQNGSLEMKINILYQKSFDKGDQRKQVKQTMR